MPINSNSYRENDTTRYVKNVVLPNEFSNLSARDFDVSPTPFSSDLMTRMQESSEYVLSMYGGNSGKSIDFATRYGIDSLMAYSLNLPLQQVQKNHSLYVRMFTGTDMEDKSFFEAFEDSWETQNVQAKIAGLQNRFDYSNDPDEKKQINADIADLQKQLVKLGDYSSRSWFGTQAVAAAPIFNQVVRTSANSLIGSIIFSGLTALTGGTATALGTGLISIGNAARLGAKAGVVYDAIANVYMQERGMASRELYEMVDANGNRLDDKTRRKWANIIAAGTTFIEYFTPEPGLGPKLKGMPDSIVINPIKKYILSSVKGAASESIEEGLQSVWGEVGNSVAQWYANKYGTYEFNSRPVSEIMRESLSSGITSFGETFFPSLLVGAVPGITEMSPNRFRAYTIIRDTVGTSDDIKAVNERQNTDDNTKIVKNDFIVYKEDPVSSGFQPPEDGGKFPAVKVTLNREKGTYTPVDDYNNDVAKYLYNQGLKSLAIEIVDDPGSNIDTETIRTISNDFGGIRDDSTNTTYFDSQRSLNNFINAVREDAVITYADDGRIIMDYETAEGDIITENLAIDQTIAQEAINIQDSTSQATSIPTSQRPQAFQQAVQRENTRIANEESDRTKFWNYLSSSFDESRKQDRNRRVSKESYHRVKNKTLNTAAEAMVLLSRATGLSADDIINKRIKLDIDLSKDATSQTAVRRGWVQSEMDADGNEVFTITLTRNANERTIVHEVGHIIRRLLSDEELAAFSSEYGVDVGGTWLTDITERNGKYYLGNEEFNTREEAETMAGEFEEQFARDFEAYVAEGKAPTPTLASIFEKMKKFIAGLLKSNYSNLNDNLRRAYDQLFSKTANSSARTIEERVSILYQDDIKRARARDIVARAEQNNQNGTDQGFTMESRVPSPSQQMSDEDFIKALDEGRVLEYETLRDKTKSSNKDVSRRAKIELIDREMFDAVPDDYRAMVTDAPNADYYIDNVNQKRETPLNENEERILRKFYKIQTFPSIERQGELLLQRMLDSGKGVSWLKNRFMKTYTARTRYGRVIRNYLPGRGRIFTLLNRIKENGDNTQIAVDIMADIKENPAEWVQAYYERSDSPEPLDSRFTLEELRSSAESVPIKPKTETTSAQSENITDKATSSITVEESMADGEVIDTDVTVAEMEVEEANKTKGNVEAEIEENDLEEQETALILNTMLEVYKPLEEITLEDLDDGTPLTDYERTLEESLKKLQADINELRKNKRALKGQVSRRDAKIEKLKSTIDDLKIMVQLTREVERARKNEQIKNLKKRHNDYIQQLRKRMDDLRKVKNDLKYDLTLTEKRLETAQNKLSRYKAGVEINRRTRSIKRMLSYNKATDDVRFIEVARYIYFLLKGGQIRRNQTYGAEYTAQDYTTEMYLTGRTQEGKDGGTVNLFKTDSQGNIIPDTEFDFDFGLYRYDRTKVPEMLAQFLPKETLDKLTDKNRLSNRKDKDTGKYKDFGFRDLELADVRNLEQAMRSAKKKAKALLSLKKDQYYSNLMEAEMELATAAAPDVYGDDVQLSQRATDIMLRYYKVDSIDQLTEAQKNSFRLKHPTIDKEMPKIGKFKELRTMAKLQFFKMQTLANELDGGKAGKFTKYFFDRPLEALKNYYKNIEARSNGLITAQDEILGDSKKRKAKNEEFFNKTFTVTLNNKYTRELTGTNLMGIYIYAQNALSFAKLVSSNGNNLSLETMAEINPDYTLRFVETEIEERERIKRANEERTQRTRMYRGEEVNLKPIEYAKTMLYEFSDEELNNVKRFIEAKQRAADPQIGYKGILPEYARKFGDAMINLFAKEQNRYAEAVYDQFNEIIEIQDRYFPFVSGTKAIGELLGEMGKKMKNVNSGSKEARQIDKSYELYLEPMSIFISKSRVQEKFISMGSTLRDMHRMMESYGGNLGEILKSKYGVQVEKYFNDYINYLAGEREQLSDFDRIFNRVIGNVAVSKLAANLMTAIRQTLSIIPAVTDGEINIADFIKASNDLRSDRKLWNETIADLAPEIQNSTMNVEIQRLRETSDNPRLSKFMEQYGDVLMTPIESTDKVIKKIVWIAAYNKALNNGMSSVEAATSASRLVQRTQSTTLDVSLAPLQRSQSPWLRLAFMFSNDLFQMWNIIFGGIFQDYKNRNWGRFFERLAGVALSVGITALLAGGWLPDKDDDEEEFFSLKDFGHDSFGQVLEYIVPIGGQAVSDYYEGWSSSFYTGFNELFAFLRMGYKDFITNDEDYVWNEWLSQTLDTGLSLSTAVAPVPEVQINRLIDSMFPEGYNGGFSFNPGTLIMGKRWGEGLSNLLD